MLKKYIALLAPDANAGTGSSSVPDANEQNSSSAEQTEQQTAEEVAEETTETAVSEETVSEETVEETTENQTSEEQVEEQVEETAEELDKPEDAKLDFHKHPRFKEVVQEKNQVRRELDEVKPLVDQAKVTNDFLRDNQISREEYQSALTYLSLLRTDPSAAYRMLQPTYEQLALLAGERLPADLQAEVAAGTMPAERATELARMRAQQTYQNWKGSQQQQLQQGTQMQQVQATVQNVVQTKQSTDPDFKPGSPLWEQVELRIKSMPVFQTPQAAQQGIEKAYTEAKAFMGKFAPRTGKPNQQALRSRPTNHTTGVAVKTAADVMKAIAAGAKPHQLRYS